MNITKDFAQRVENLRVEISHLQNLDACSEVSLDELSSFFKQFHSFYKFIWDSPLRSLLKR